MTRNVVILTPFFPPSSLAGVHRPRHLAKHLPALGWHPIVLCVDEAYHEQALDPALARLVPPQTEVVKVAALPIALTRRLGVGDITLRAWPQLRARLVDLLRSRPISVVMITSAPYFPMLLTSMIKREFGVPVVLDFQDPWVSRWGAEQPKWSKAGLAHRAAILLEPQAVGHADFITSVSQGQNEEMAARYPWLDRSRMAGLPIGGDPEDFHHLKSATTIAGPTLGDTGRIELSYVGSYWPAAAEPIRAFLRGVARLRTTHPELIGRLRLNFVGTDATLIGDCYQIRPIAEAEGVADCVRELPSRLPYLEALGITARSDGLILIGSDEPHYTASKIYPALMSGRPYLSIFHRESSAHAILSAAGGGIALSFAGAGELSSLEGAIADGLLRLALAPDALGAADPAAYAPFSARLIAGQYAAIFERISSAPSLATPHKTELAGWRG